MIYPVAGLALGLVLGLFLPIRIPQEYAKFMSVALLASMDSVFGGLRSVVEKKYEIKFLSAAFL